MTTGVIQLDHGTGGGMSQELIAELIAPRLGAVHSGRMEDSAVLELEVNRIALDHRLVRDRPDLLRQR